MDSRGLMIVSDTGAIVERFTKALGDLDQGTIRAWPTGGLFYLYSKPFPGPLERDSRCRGSRCRLLRTSVLVGAVMLTGISFLGA